MVGLKQVKYDHNYYDKRKNSMDRNNVNKVNNGSIPVCPPLRPIFQLQVLGVNGSALVDTAARRCVAGQTLCMQCLRRSPTQ